MTDEKMKKEIEDLYEKGKLNEFEYYQLKSLCDIGNHLDGIRLIFRDFKNHLIYSKKEK